MLLRLVDPRMRGRCTETKIHENSSVVLNIHRGALSTTAHQICYPDELSGLKLCSTESRLVCDEGGL